MSIELNIFQLINARKVDALKQILVDSPERALDRDNFGLSPILFALYYRLDDMIPIIRAAGMPLDIFEAAAVGDSDRIRQLLDADATLVRAWTRDGFRPLHYAARFSGDVESATRLLDAGANPNVSVLDSVGLTPLHYAIWARHHTVAHPLVSRGADANDVAGGYQTPLHFAAHNGDEAAVDFLMIHGADVGIVRFDDHTAADIAEAEGHLTLAARLRGLS